MRKFKQLGWKDFLKGLAVVILMGLLSISIVALIISLFGG